jgi:hypothetical protein
MTSAHTNNGTGEAVNGRLEPQEGSLRRNGVPLTATGVRFGKALTLLEAQRGAMSMAGLQEKEPRQ